MQGISPLVTPNFQKDWLKSEMDLYICPPKDDETWTENNITIVVEPCKSSIARLLYEDCDYGKINRKKFYPLRLEMPGFIVVDAVESQALKISFIPILKLSFVAENDIGKSEWIPRGHIKNDIVNYMKTAVKQNMKDDTKIPVWMRWHDTNMHALFIGY